ncbi:MAG: translation initiation factor IF-2 [Pseudomonadota bacterium]|nr:translation initiation factor IF-2 [Pseudomonadota bacterium]MEC9458446.1 translation initiation factor IF-2 [Pseudomonadota bacterium]
MSEDDKKDKKDKTLSLKASATPAKNKIGSRARGASRVSTVVVESKRGKISKTRKPNAPNIKTRSSSITSRKIKEPTGKDEDTNNLTLKERVAREKALIEADDRKKKEVIDTKKSNKEAKKKTKKEGDDIAKAQDLPVQNDFDSTQKKKSNTSSTKKKDLKSAEKDKDDRKKRKEPQKRRKGKLTISEALNEDERQRSLASIRRRQEKAKKKIVDIDAPKEKISRNVVIPESITVQELSNRMAERSVDVIKSLMQQGVMVKINDYLDADTAELIVEEFGHQVTRVSEADVEQGISDDDDLDENKLPRSPVVTIMGHVDHGKTSLLDSIRQTSIVTSEAGGITQHIGAYQINTNNTKITFIDTPGHAAFTSMRARGAKVTDIVILVVAADDSVMPQTVEAINHSKDAGVPMIIAINKIDKPEANPTKTKNDLLEHELIVEELGGEIQCVELSAETKEGIDNLIEAINLQAEILDLKANPNRPAEGFVIESKLDKGRGPVVSTIIQRGTLKKGDVVIVGQYWGKVRSLINDKGEQVKECYPGEPIEVLGLNNTPNAGDFLSVVENESRAREISEYRERQNKKLTPNVPQSNIEQMLSKIKDDVKKEISVIIKADVHGSSEAIKDGLLKIGNEEISCRVVHSGVGAISESDISLAETSNSIVFGFNVRANSQAKELAEKSDINITYHSIIYDLLDEMKGILEGKLDPEIKETIIGNAEVLEVFKISKTGNIAGCLVSDGTVKRGENARLIRDDIVVYDGKISELKRFKDDAKEVQSGQECGIAFDNNEDIKANDRIECYEVLEIKKKID